MGTAISPDRQLHRSFRLIDSSTVEVTINRKRTRYTVTIGPAADCDGNPETIVSLRSGHEVLHVTIACDGSAMCHCNRHFDRNGCWHADLAMALVKHLEACSVLTVEDTDGNRLCDIVSESGLCGSHRKLVALIRSKPHLLQNREQLEALELWIAGTRIRVVRPN